MEKFSLWTIVLLTFMAEMPCILRAVAIQLQNDKIANVVWGTIIGSILALITGIIIAKLIKGAGLLNLANIASYVSGIAIIGLGIYILLKEH